MCIMFFILFMSIFIPNKKKITFLSGICVQEDDDLSKWKRYWCSLKNLQLSCWSSPDDVEVAQPLMAIPVTKVTVAAWHQA